MKINALPKHISLETVFIVQAVHIFNEAGVMELLKT